MRSARGEFASPAARVADAVAVRSLHGRLVSVEGSRRLEVALRALFGQPLSVRRWSEMTFNDKVIFRKLRSREPFLREFSDKMAMRHYVEGVLGPDLLPRLVRVATSIGDVADLEGPFVLKASHGAGMVLFVTDERRLTERELDTARHWLTVDYGYWGREWGYDGLPRALMVEELLADPAPPDIKVFVFDGTARVIQVDLGRFSDHHRCLLTPTWDVLGASKYPPPPNPPPVPRHLAEIVGAAELLARGFAFVRVDLFDLADRILVGEISCYPESGRCRFDPPELDRWMGSLWSTPPEVVA